MEQHPVVRSLAVGGGYAGDAPIGASGAWRATMSPRHDFRGTSGPGWLHGSSTSTVTPEQPDNQPAAIGGPTSQLSGWGAARPPPSRTDLMVSGPIG